MAWTKQQYIEQAFAEIGLAAYVFDLTPDQLNIVLRRLDGMVGSWTANGIHISYPLPSNPNDSNLSDVCNVPDFAHEAIYLGLACRIAPMFGKTVAQETKTYADNAYSQMLNSVALPTPERYMPRTMPRGQGTKPWRNFNNPFVYGTEEPLLDGNNAEIILE